VNDLLELHQHTYFGDFLISDSEIRFAIRPYYSEFWLIAGKDKFIEDALGMSVEGARRAFRREVEKLRPDTFTSDLYRGFSSLADKYGAVLLGDH
jgi:hypothetical protein